MVADFKRRFWITLVLSIPVLVLSPTLQGFFGVEGLITLAGQNFVQLALATAIFIFGGWPFLKGLFEELGNKQPGMMTLIGLAIGVAYFYSAAVSLGLPGKVFYWELATLIVIMLLGHWIEMRSVLGASKALDELARLLPDSAHKVLESGEINEVSVKELETEDVVLIKPGEKVPADGKIIEGSSSFNESMISGESRPVQKSEGEEVIGGSVNGDNAVKIRIAKTGEDSFLHQIQEMVRKAQAGKSKAQNMADRAAMWLTFTAITAGAATLGIWLAALGREFAFSLERMVTVMVITCPHALGLAIPLVVAVYTSKGAQNGFLIRNRTPFESAREIDTVLFDKTGTLTSGEFKVTDVITFGGISEEELLDFAGAVEKQSEHSIAEAIASKAGSSKSAENFEAVKGKGARAEVDGKRVELFSHQAAKEAEWEIPEKAADDLPGSGKTLTFVRIDGTTAGLIALGDSVRPESSEVVGKLEKMGIESAMITGDNESVARNVAEELGIDTWYAEVRPEDKNEKVKELQQQGKKVSMVGDGVNDAPALAQADLGVAIGAGTDVAMESADAVLVNDDPRDIAKLISLSKNTRGKMIQNLWWASGYNIIAIPLAAGILYPFGILLSPAVGALLMSLSTVIVAINANFLEISPE